MSSSLEDEVALVIFQATLRDTPSINHWQVRRVCREIVRRLLAGGISETAIRNTLVHHRTTCDHWSCGGNPCLIGGLTPPAMEPEPHS